MRSSISAEAPAAAVRPVPVILAYGFRPFFLACAAWAVAAVALWVAALAGVLPAGFDAVDLGWHQHEMLFGVFGAAVAGFVLTAFPEWTKAQPITGAPLGVLFALWAAGRVVMLAGASRPSAAVIAAAFLPSVAAIAAAVVFTKRPPRLWLFVAVLASFAAISVAWQLARAGILPFDPAVKLALPGLLLTATLVTLAAGRIVPIVSQLALRSAESDRLLRAEPASTDVAVCMLLLLVALILADVSSSVVGWVALAAAAAQLHRAAEWWIGTAGRRVYIWPFHLSALMIAASAAAIGFERLGVSVPSSSIAHALGLGGAGLATLAVMTIAGLLHTGHSLDVPWGVAAALALLALAAILRAAAPWLDAAAAAQAVDLAGTAWIAAFLLYLAVMGPRLLRPRVDGKPG